MAKNLTKLICALLVIAILAVVAVFGIDNVFTSEKGDKLVQGVFDDGAIRKGLDLAGGTLIVYQPDVEDISSVTDEQIDTVISIMTRRLSGAGYTEASIAALDDGKIQIEIPEVKNLDEARSLLGNIGELLFIGSDGTVVLTGNDIKGATAQYGQPGANSIAPEHFVSLTLKDSAIVKFSAATEKAASAENIKNQTNFIMIVLDNEIVSMPYVSEKLTSKDVVISGGNGGFTEDAAKSLASVIASGQLPFTLKELRADTVGPTLGEKALETAIFAGLIGILLVMLFMIAVYRLPGLVSCIALVAYMGIEALVLVLFKVNLSLPGIAGIVLSIGMAVDANVIINERIKEELRVGKGTLSSVKSGFSKAFTSIIDSNVTTIIASLVLWYFGTGTIQGFAITLFIGIVVSMISALLVTRFLMYAIVGVGAKNSKLYGI